MPSGHTMHTGPSVGPKPTCRSLSRSIRLEKSIQWPRPCAAVYWSMGWPVAETALINRGQVQDEPPPKRPGRVPAPLEKLRQLPLFDTRWIRPGAPELVTLDLLGE
jgi:hypothetical protein